MQEERRTPVLQGKDLFSAPRRLSCTLGFSAQINTARRSLFSFIWVTEPFKRIVVLVLVLPGEQMFPVQRCLGSWVQSLSSTTHRVSLQLACSKTQKGELTSLNDKQELQVFLIMSLDSLIGSNPSRTNEIDMVDRQISLL